MFTSVIVMIAVLGIIIIAHELGHFLMAKAWHMDVRSFSIGFGPKLLGGVHGGIEYALRCIPAGGFVRISGMLSPDEREYFNRYGMLEENLADDGEITENSYCRKPPLARFMVLAAGSGMNFLLSGFLFAALFYFNPDNWPGITADMSLLEAIWHGFHVMVERLFELLYAWGAGVSEVQVMGPVGIAAIGAENFHTGWSDFILFIALVNLQLAIMNLFPLPIFDGGKIFGIVVEVVCGKAVHVKYTFPIQVVFVVLLVVFKVYVTVQDILRL